MPPSIPSEFYKVLGNSLTLNLQNFPELDWLTTYLDALSHLQAERDRLTQAIQAIAQEGDVYRDQWIEPYTKTKNGKHYSYYQVRWLTGAVKPSGQPQVKTKHLSHQQVGEVRAAIARGHQVEALEKQRQLIETQIAHLQQVVGKTNQRLQQALSQL